MLAYDCGSDQARLWQGDDGGAKRDRTADLLRARQALSQLSYGPEAICVRQGASMRRIACYASIGATRYHANLVGLGRFEQTPRPHPSLYEPQGVRSNQLSERMVGLGRFELPTSPLSGVRSNQLSYRPVKRLQARDSRRIKPIKRRQMCGHSLAWRRRLRR